MLVVVVVVGIVSDCGDTCSGGGGGEMNAKI